MEELNIFNDIDVLEPKCPKCRSKIDYGITTTWNERKQAHVCNSCGNVLR